MPLAYVGDRFEMLYSSDSVYVVDNEMFRNNGPDPLRISNPGVVAVFLRTSKLLEDAAEYTCCSLNGRQAQAAKTVVEEKQTSPFTPVCSVCGGALEKGLDSSWCKSCNTVGMTTAPDDEPGPAKVTIVAEPHEDAELAGMNMLRQVMDGEVTRLNDEDECGRNYRDLNNRIAAWFFKRYGEDS